MRAVLALVLVLAAIPAQAQLMVRHWAAPPLAPSASCPYNDVTLASNAAVQICASASQSAQFIQPDFYYGHTGVGTPGVASQSTVWTGLPNSGLNSYIVGSITASISGSALTVTAGNTALMVAGLSLCDANGKCAGGSGSKIAAGTYLVSGSGSSWTVSKTWNVPSETMYLVSRPTYNVPGVDYPVGQITADASLVDPAGHAPTGCTYYDGTGTYSGGALWLAGSLNWWSASSTKPDGPGGWIGNADGIQLNANPSWKGSPVLWCPGSAGTTTTISGLQFGPIGGHACTELLLAGYLTTANFDVHDNHFNLTGLCNPTNINGTRYNGLGAQNGLAMIATVGGGSANHGWIKAYNNTLDFNSGDVGGNKWFGAPHDQSSSPWTCGGLINCGGTTGTLPRGASTPQRIFEPYGFGVYSDCSTSNGNCTATQHAVTIAYNLIRNAPAHMWSIQGVTNSTTPGPGAGGGAGVPGANDASSTFSDVYANALFAFENVCAGGHGETNFDKGGNTIIQNNNIYQPIGTQQCNSAIFAANLGNGIDHRQYIIDSNSITINGNGGNVPIGVNAVVTASSISSTTGLITFSSTAGYTLGGFEAIQGKGGLLHGASGGSFYYDCGAATPTNDICQFMSGSGGSYNAAPATNLGPGYSMTLTALNTSFIWDGVNGGNSGSGWDIFWDSPVITNNWIDLSSTGKVTPNTTISYNSGTGQLTVTTTNFFMPTSPAPTIGAVITLTAITGNADAVALNGDWPLVSSSGATNAVLQGPTGKTPSFTTYGYLFAPYGGGSSNCVTDGTTSYPMVVSGNVNLMSGLPVNGFAKENTPTGPTGSGASTPAGPFVGCGGI